MTIAQQFIYLEGLASKQSKPGIVTHDSIEEAMAYRQQRQAAINGQES